MTDPGIFSYNIYLKSGIKGLQELYENMYYNNFTYDTVGKCHNGQKILLINIPFVKKLQKLNHPELIKIYFHNISISLDVFLHESLTYIVKNNLYEAFDKYQFYLDRINEKRAIIYCFSYNNPKLAKKIFKMRQRTFADIGYIIEKACELKEDIDQIIYFYKLFINLYSNNKKVDHRKNVQILIINNHYNALDLYFKEIKKNFNLKFLRYIYYSNKYSRNSNIRRILLSEYEKKYREVNKIT